MNFTLRPATVADAEAVHAATLAAYAEHAALIASTTALDEPLCAVREGLASGKFAAAVAEQNGQIVGSVRFRTENDGLYFFRLAVVPAARRRGIARAFVGFLEDEAARRGLTFLRCCVRAEVEQNLAMYEAMSFTATGERFMKRAGLRLLLVDMEKRIAGSAEGTGRGASRKMKI